MVFQATICRTPVCCMTPCTVSPLRHSGVRTKRQACGTSFIKVWLLRQYATRRQAQIYRKTSECRKSFDQRFCGGSNKREIQEYLQHPCRLKALLLSVDWCHFCARWMRVRMAKRIVPDGSSSGSRCKRCLQWHLWPWPLPPFTFGWPSDWCYHQNVTGRKQTWWQGGWTNDLEYICIIIVREEDSPRINTWKERSLMCMAMWLQSINCLHCFINYHQRGMPFGKQCATVPEL